MYIIIIINDLRSITKMSSADLSDTNIYIVEMESFYSFYVILYATITHVA